MREHASGGASPVSPSPLVSGSPAEQAGDLAHPPPQVPDHELLHPIGHGAYGEVWLARSVVGTLRAVKVVRRHDFGDEHPFDREFRGIQKFEPLSRSHPGLVNILQIGRNDAEGYFYYVMELADDVLGEKEKRGDGEKESNTPERVAAQEDAVSSSPSLPFSPASYAPRTLRHDLKTRGRLPTETCVDLGLALTSALEHLHQHGLVHRDIKPSNIIFVNGRPKLADIGLVTEAGDSQSIVGTEGYLAPEGPGSPQADLFSLGKLLYEMSTGQDRRQYPDLPVKLKEWPDASGLRELNEVVLKACAKDVASRYQSAGQMHADLSRLQAGKSMRWRGNLGRVAGHTKRVWPLLATLLLLLLAIPWVLRRQESRPPVVPTAKASVFVLPFRSEGTNGVSDDLRGRITDAFIDSLALIEGVRRSPRKSGWVHQDEAMLRHSLAETNEMRHILTGRISGSGDILTITLRLHARGEDQPVWTESFTGTTNEVIAVERRALAQIASTLGLKITGTEQQKIDLLLTNNFEALKWMRQACVTYQRKAGTQTGYTEVQTILQKALEADPSYVDAEYLMLYQIRVLSQDRSPIEVWPTVFRGMSQILEKDDTHASALEQLAGYGLFYKHDWSNTYELNKPEMQCRSGSDKLSIRAFWYRIHGWFEEARIAQRMSEEPAPTGIDQRMCMAAACWVDRQFAQGTQVARRTLELYPGNAEGYFHLAHCLVAGGQFESGLEAIEKAQRDWRRPELTALKAYAYAGMGETNEAHKVLDELMNIERTGPYLQPYFVARVYAALGQNAKTLDWLEKAEIDRSEYLFFADFGGLRTDPAWDGLQNEPRYWQLCERLGLGKTQWPRPKPEPMP